MRLIDEVYDACAQHMYLEIYKFEGLEYTMEAALRGPTCERLNFGICVC